MKPAVYAELNLAAVRHNLSVVRHYAPQAKILAVIKANGYGHGLVRIATAAAQADGFAVARIDEALRLRHAGFQQRIVLLGGFYNAHELAQISAHQLEPIIHSFEQIHLLAQQPSSEKISVWLKLDSGMNRLGFNVAEFHQAYQQLTQISAIRSIQLLTHLASADNPNDAKTLVQIQLFNETVAAYSGERCIANSAGILAWPNSITDWVRPGLMLYGISPFAETTSDNLGLLPVMSLYSRLIAIKHLNPGETVGYNGSWVCNLPTRLGVVAIGYGDGYPRSAKNGTPVFVRGQRVSLIGRVSMDMLTIDLTAIPEAKIGDKVELWGEHLPIEEIAVCAETIPYTLVCGVTERVPRMDCQV